MNKELFLENLKSGLLEIIILKVVQIEGQIHCWDIPTKIKELSNNLIKVPVVSCYNPLKKLQKNGYLEVKKVVVGKTRFRNYYSITDLGIKYLYEAREVYETFTNGVDAILFNMEVK